MAWCPTPITIVSASVNRGEALQTYDALAAGAVDVVDKPSAAEARQPWEAAFLARVRMVSRIKVITHPRGRLNGSGRLASPFGRHTSERPGNASVESSASGVTAKLRALPSGGVRAIAIGASTGGPAAVSDILRSLPADFPIPLLLVIHVSDQFAFALAEWLNTQSRIPVGFAVDGQALPPFGKAGVILAPAGSHMVVEGNYVRLRKTGERHSCRPSVDELFESVASQLAPAAACVLLTGMGRDGAEGLLAARRAGCITIAQDEATSIVFGMPGEGIRLGATDTILPLQRIAPAFVNMVASLPAKGGSL
jgi:two-component system chemotaxis response regulator CheB